MIKTNVKPDPNTYGFGFCGKCPDDTFFFGFSTPPDDSDLESFDCWQAFIEWFAEEYPTYDLQSIWKCFFKDFEAIVEKRA